MKVIVAGSRDASDYLTVAAAIQGSGFDITQLVSGGAPGVDTFGERYAKEHDIEIKVFPANWNLHGKSAGPIRNREMADYADALVAVWDGKSRGTKNMIQEAQKRDLQVYVLHYNTKELLDE